MQGGDINGDGFDDFLGRTIYDGNASYGCFWQGSSIITTQWDVQLYPVYFGTDWPHYDLIHGDLNNDGFDDLIGSDYEAWGDSGRLAIWLGKQNFKGTADLFLTPPDEIPYYSHFGYALACGDFNNDGFDDLAVGAPQSPPGLSDVPGALVIYSGNAQLADTSVATEDELAPQLNDALKFSSYPNPLPVGKAVSLRYQGKGYDQLNTKTISLYNLKGQRVFQAQDSSRGDTSSIQLPELPSGVYIIKVSAAGQHHSSKRIVVY